MDSEDEAYLSERPHIEPRVLERIFDTLEAQSSDNNICWPETARAVLTSFDESIVDDVYDYWLTKRQKAMQSRTFNLGIGGLIPKIRNDCRKDASGTVNPYVAFRRRAEKMQTRKNRKNDEESYEKVLKLSYDLRKSVTLFDMVKRREKTKMVVMDLDSQLLSARIKLDDHGSAIYNQYISRLGIPDLASISTPLKSSLSINGVSTPKVDSVRDFPNSKSILLIHFQDYECSTPKNNKKQRKRKIRPSTTNLDREVPNKAWLKKNAEVWNRPPTVFSPSSIISPVVEVDRSAQIASEENLDGRYTFKRRRGCIYRAAMPVLPMANRHNIPPEQIAKQNHLFKTHLVGVNGIVRSFGMARRRLGRGGRVIVDRLVHNRHKQQASEQAAAKPSSSAALPAAQPAYSTQAPPLRVPKVFDPFDDELLEDHNVTFRARPPVLVDEDEDFEPFSFAQRRRMFVNRFGTGDSDEERERKWRMQSQPDSTAQLPSTSSAYAGSDSRNLLTKISPHYDRPPPSEEEMHVERTRGRTAAGEKRSSDLKGTEEEAVDADADADAAEAAGSPAKRRSSSTSTDASSPGQRNEAVEEEEQDMEMEDEDDTPRLGGCIAGSDAGRKHNNKLILDESGNGQTGRVDRARDTKMGSRGNEQSTDAHDRDNHMQGRGLTQLSDEHCNGHANGNIKIEDIELETKSSVGSSAGSTGMGGEWRSASGSPSESNSSAEWNSHPVTAVNGNGVNGRAAHRAVSSAPAPSLGAHIAFVLASEEEARTGEHPVSARHPPIGKQPKLDDCTQPAATAAFLLSAAAAATPPASLS
ncbi:hypothetical protein WR25_01727 [Diploscapter pachys]|uniref:Enhancer of polycomb-like protein n=1 Tax=Diploscapter pachys TaxID=2018661 RepID=A0A2A2LRU1_9BILA|nr:hypothetical protein WR25_01727 [Diploscapter pachys]